MTATTTTKTAQLGSTNQSASAPARPGPPRHRSLRRRPPTPPPTIVSLPGLTPSPSRPHPQPPLLLPPSARHPRTRAALPHTRCRCPRLRLAAHPRALPRTETARDPRAYHRAITALKSSVLRPARVDIDPALSDAARLHLQPPSLPPPSRAALVAEVGHTLYKDTGAAFELGMAAEVDWEEPLYHALDEQAKRLGTGHLRCVRGCDWLAALKPMAYARKWPVSVPLKRPSSHAAALLTAAAPETWSTRWHAFWRGARLDPIRGLAQV